MKPFFTPLFTLLALLAAGAVVGQASLTVSATTFEVGEPISFTYNSPNWVDTDWIGIYNKGETPGVVNSITYQYIPQAAGTATFTDELEPGEYTAFLLCCDSYDVLASADFTVEETGGGGGMVESVKEEYASGETMSFEFESPTFSATDWIGIYKAGSNPDTDLSETWQYITQASGTLNFPGSLEAGEYEAYLFCCNSLGIIAKSERFTVKEGIPGALLKTNASVYPEGSPVIFTYASPVYDPTDWIGIYNKGETPGDVSSIDFQYIPAASGNLAFTTSLAPGLYTAYLFCCDGYTVYASVNFEIGGANTASLVATKLNYLPGEDIVFTYNSPNFSSADWIGIYAPGEQPGDVGSTEWDYIPSPSGQLTLPSGNLYEGDWVAYLLCCDGYDVYATSSFTISLTSSVKETAARVVQAYPNPTNGVVTLDLPQTEQVMRMEVMDGTGRLVASGAQATIDLAAMPNGIFTLIATTSQGNTYAARISLQR